MQALFPVLLSSFPDAEVAVPDDSQVRELCLSDAHCCLELDEFQACELCLSGAQQEQDDSHYQAGHSQDVLCSRGGLRVQAALQAWLPRCLQDDSQAQQLV